MADGQRTSAASIRQRLLNLARAEGRVHEVVLIRYALERLLHRLSISDHRDRFALKGGMLVTLWIDGGNRETPGRRLLGFGEPPIDALMGDLRRDHGDTRRRCARIRYRRAARRPDPRGPGRPGCPPPDRRLHRANAHPGDHRHRFRRCRRAEAGANPYPSLLAMEEPLLQAYPPAAVIAEKFQAMVAPGAINGRMKDYRDLWAIRMRSRFGLPISTQPSKRRSSEERPPSRPPRRKVSRRRLPKTPRRSAGGETIPS